jgi:histidyl-tRNA synthetase
LISDLGGPAIPGIGFAMGVERVALLLDAKEFRTRPDLFIVALGDEAQERAFALMCALQLAGVTVEIDYEGKSLKSQLRRADKFNSRFSLIIGGDELARGTAVLKDMDRGTQQDVVLKTELVLGAIS